MAGVYDAPDDLLRYSARHADLSQKRDGLRRRREEAAASVASESGLVRDGAHLALWTASTVEATERTEQRRLLGLLFVAIVVLKGDKGGHATVSKAKISARLRYADGAPWDEDETDPMRRGESDQPFDNLIGAVLGEGELVEPSDD
jgi:hypothetical protein